MFGAALFLGGGREVGEDTSFGDGGVPHEFVEFFVVPDGEKDVPGDDSGLLVILGGVASELEDLSGEVFEDGCEVDGSTCTNSFSIVSISEKSSDSSDWELKSSSHGL